MVKKLIQICVVVSSCICLSFPMTACQKEDSIDKEYEIDFTVVEDADLPIELSKLIDSKKDKVIRLTYTTKDYTYVVAGYGTKDTSGYSIQVNDVFGDDDTVCVDLSLLGPSESEAVNEVETYPYIVLKMERRDENIVFKM